MAERLLVQFEQSRFWAAAVSAYQAEEEGLHGCRKFKRMSEPVVAARQGKGTR